MISLAKRLLHHTLRSLNRKLVPIHVFGSHAIDDIVSLLRPIKGTLSVMDVGANVGCFSKEMVQAAPNSVVHAFEPFPAAYDQLQTLAQSVEGRIVPHGNAMSNEVGTSVLFLNSADVTNSLLPNADSASEYQPDNFAVPTGSLEVSLDTVDRFCQNQNISLLHLLKIDTQGADLRVLQGASRMIENGQVCLVLVEALFVPLYSGQCWFHEIQHWMHERGFSLVHLYEINRDLPLQSIKWADALFVHRSAIRRALEVQAP
jgi:FkbM family methyltransferase